MYLKLSLVVISTRAFSSLFQKDTQYYVSSPSETNYGPVVVVRNMKLGLHHVVRDCFVQWKLLSENIQNSFSEQLQRKNWIIT